MNPPLTRPTATVVAPVLYALGPATGLGGALFTAPGTRVHRTPLPPLLPSHSAAGAWSRLRRPAGRQRGGLLAPPLPGGGQRARAQHHRPLRLQWRRRGERRRAIPSASPRRQVRVSRVPCRRPHGPAHAAPACRNNASYAAAAAAKRGYVFLGAEVPPFAVDASQVPSAVAACPVRNASSHLLGVVSVYMAPARLAEGLSGLATPDVAFAVVGANGSAVLAVAPPVEGRAGSALLVLRSMGGDGRKGGAGWCGSSLSLPLLIRCHRWHSRSRRRAPHSTGTRPHPPPRPRVSAGKPRRDRTHGAAGSPDHPRPCRAFDSSNAEVEVEATGQWKGEGRGRSGEVTATRAPVQLSGSLNGASAGFFSPTAATWSLVVVQRSVPVGTELLSSLLVRPCPLRPCHAQCSPPTLPAAAVDGRRCCSGHGAGHQRHGGVVHWRGEGRAAAEAATGGTHRRGSAGARRSAGREQGQEPVSGKHEVRLGRHTRVNMPTLPYTELALALTQCSSPLCARSHEIRTPMTGILGLVDLMLDAADLSDEHRDNLRSVRHCGKTLLQLLNDILDLVSPRAPAIAPIGRGQRA